MARIQSRRAFTLVEAVVSLGVSAILLTGLGSSIMLATRALPQEENAHQAVIRTSALIDDIVTELHTATTVTERTATTLEFTVADRDADQNSETIRYSWSGTPGDPLKRQYNGGPAATVAEGVNEFDLTYVMYTQTETRVEEVITNSGTVLLAYFDGWNGIIPTYKSQPVSTSYWESQYFTVIPPAGTSQLQISSARVMLQHAGIPPEGVTVGIHRSRNDGTYIPDVAPIGTPATIPGNSLTTMFLWANAGFSDVIITDFARTDYCVVLKGIGAYPAYVQRLYSKNAPANGMFERWTDDGGASWEPKNNNLDKQDLTVYVYGSYTSTSSQEVEASRYFLLGVTLIARLHESPDAAVRTAARLLNAPEVATP